MYTKSDFDKCSFNPMEEGTMTKSFPKLASIIKMEWMTDNHLDKVIRYAIMVFDPKSPLISISGLKERKQTAFSITGIDKINKDAQNAIMINCYGDILPEFIVQYMINFSKSREWAIMCVVENKFWETIGILMKPIDEVVEKKDYLKSAGEKSKVLEGLKTDQSDIDYYYKMIFGEDENVEKYARKSISPQSIASLNRPNV